MQKDASKSPPWIQVALAILPGVFALTIESCQRI